MFVHGFPFLMKGYALEIPKDAIQIELAHGDNSDSKKEISEISLKFFYFWLCF